MLNKIKEMMKKREEQRRWENHLNSLYQYYTIWEYLGYSEELRRAQCKLFYGVDCYDDLQYVL